MKFKPLLFLLISYCSISFAQEKLLAPDSPLYNKLKKEGKLSQPVYQKQLQENQKLNSHSQAKVNPPFLGNTTQAFAQCNCLFPLDSTFQIAPFTNGLAPDYRNDDGSTGIIALPFSFCLYGQTYNDCYINNNGNVSFGSAYATFSAAGFPDPNFVMVAPFWADVDTRDPASGLVYYKVTPTALIVQWDSVGYFSNHSDKRCSFQLIITDGNDPLLPAGTNVAFCYGNMDWTTGDASQGQNGFGGIPSNVGANKGDGINYIQYGRFDQPGIGYDGPFGSNDSVDFLDGKTLIFNACASGGSNNIPPLVSGLNVCDTLAVCLTDTAFADTVNFNLTFYSPEQGQITNVTATGPPTLTITNNSSGNAIANITGSFTVDINSPLVNPVTIIAVDNGTPPETTTISIVYVIDTFSLSQPFVITGNNYYCANGAGVTLTSPPGYSSYLWSNGATGVNTISNAITSTYNVEVTDSFGCVYKSPPFPVYVSDPNPIISGVTAVCGQANALLETSQSYVSYLWSNSSTDSAISVGTGTYSVIVADAFGCIDTSNTINVSISNNPVAAAAANPPSVLPGGTVQFTDLSSVSGSSIVSWQWNFGDTANNVSSQQNPSHTFYGEGVYYVQLIVATVDGCTDTLIYAYRVEPTLVIPNNVFTPDNGDAANQFFYFKNLEFYDNAQLTIFNRWGKKVFEDASYANDWSGKDVSSGVYYYVLTIPERDDLAGTVTILK